MKTKFKKNKNVFGVRQELMNSIISTIFLNNKIEEIIVFGSRAKGNFKKGSDIDLAIIAKDLSLGELLEIKSKLNELPIPYKVDLVDFNKLGNNDLIEHIERVGKKIVRKPKLKSSK